MKKSPRRGHASFAPPKIGNGFMMFPPDPFAILTFMGKEGGLLLSDQAGNIHVGVRRKAMRLAAGVDFVKIDLRASFEGHAGAYRQETRDLVVEVRVDRPLRQH